MPRVLKVKAAIEKPDSDTENEETNINEPINESNVFSNEPVKQETKATKPKKPRSQAQIDVTNRMRENLKLKRQEDTKLREIARLEHEELKKKIKKKLFSTRVKEQVDRKIKEIADDNTDSEASDSSIEYIPVKKEKLRKKPTEPVKRAIPNTPNNKQYYPSSKPQHKPIIFF
jgi:hypothetical protein